MRVARRLTLLMGPMLLIGLCYAVAAPQRTAAPVTPAPTASPQRQSKTSLIADCEDRARDLLSRWGNEWEGIVRPPYVLISDLSAADLEQLYLDTILPTHYALRIDYFDHEPDRPVTVLMLSTDEQYHAAVERLGHRRRAEYSGLYARDERTLLINLASGSGTLAHELTHALAHADFPRMPEWFDEGLASLHEEARFTDDRRHLIGQHNWRLQYLHEADRRDCWKPITDLWQHRFAEPDVAALDYALARNFCLYLQEKGLLSAYYRKCRTGIDRDPTGHEALCELFPGKTQSELDADFRIWLRSLSRTAERRATRR